MHIVVSGCWAPLCKKKEKKRLPESEGFILLHIFQWDVTNRQRNRTYGRGHYMNLCSPSIVRYLMWPNTRQPPHFYSILCQSLAFVVAKDLMDPAYIGCDFYVLNKIHDGNLLISIQSMEFYNIYRDVTVINMCSWVPAHRIKVGKKQIQMIISH